MAAFDCLEKKTKAYLVRDKGTQEGSPLNYLVNATIDTAQPAINCHTVATYFLDGNSTNTITSATPCSTLVRALQVGFLLLVVLFGVCRPETWRYPTPGPDGNVGQPENWGGSCDLGRRQSPIDITYKASVKGAYTEFIFQNYDKLFEDVSLVNTGHTIQINPSDTSIAIYGGGLRSKYILEQMHFHWNSEHTIESTRYALELHLVHRHSRYESISEASAVKAGIAVLAVLFYVNEHPNLAIEAILNSTVPVKTIIDKKVPLRGEFALDDMMPKNRTVYFRYDGSLTTPVCAESVVWTVFPESLPISIGQAESFKTVHDLDDKELLLNYRPIQPLNARALVLVSETEILDSGSIRTAASHVLKLILGATWMMLISRYRI
ncbi:putative carbonic anhydrase 3 [Wyeomyia smithii]|uniref:putative carbonic anhydrase 3 n=1 Tax=Wyeomyia smithii TaxID=174621 RepID=UPI002467FE7A|nr:putative carbonic anhydrase 3 [Wyeomyia smithii]